MSKQEKLKEKLKKLDHDALQRFADRTCSKKGIGRNELWEKVPPLAEVLHEKGLLEKPGVDEGEDDLDALIDLEGDETASVDEPMLERPMSADEKEPEDIRLADDVDHEHDEGEELLSEEEMYWDDEGLDDGGGCGIAIIGAVSFAYFSFGAIAGICAKHLVDNGIREPDGEWALMTGIASSACALILTIGILLATRSERNHEEDSAARTGET